MGEDDLTGRVALTELYFTAAEIETLGRLVNGLGIIGSQLILRNRPDLYPQAHANLRKCKSEYEELLKRLDRIARQSEDESALRLIEDLDVVPTDATQNLLVARRCLLAAAFLGHCIVSYSHPHRPTITSPAHKRLN